VKPRLDNAPPPSLGMKHLENRMKKKQMQEDRFTEIERENKHLVEKMTCIMRHNAVDQRRGGYTRPLFSSV
jgi:hypothetical protein